MRIFKHGLALRIFLGAMALLGAVPCFGACVLQQFAELKVTMLGTNPTVQIEINGTPLRMVVDSGAFFSMLTPGTAAQLKLYLEDPAGMALMSGSNGFAAFKVATAKEFKIASATVHHVQFVVGGSELHGVAGVIGQNVLRIADVEYDLANGVIRLIKPKGCGNNPLAYWAKSQPFSEMDLDSTSAEQPFTIGTATVDGSKIRVMFDSGASFSTLTQKAAEQIGIKPDTPNVKPGGSTYGIGRNWVRTWIAPISDFKLGDEEVRNTHIRFSDMPSFTLAHMLIGDDFFLSHHLYVSNDQHKLYFTYNGGLVFNLTTTPERFIAGAPAPPPASPSSDSDAAPPVDASTSAATASPPPQSNPTPSSPDNPADAVGFSQRGMAFAARRDFADAIAALDRACELAPQEADYRYQRGLVHLEDHQADLAMTDLNTAISLKPDHIDALMLRAQLHSQAKDHDDELKDLDTVANAAAHEADIRFALANAYSSMEQYPQAVAQYDLWIPIHRADIKLPNAYNGRCWARAMLGQDLKQALDDCDRAVRAFPKAASFLDSRGLVRLRMGDYKKSAIDYGAAIQLQPKSAWSLYGRGLDEQHLGDSAASQSDIAAAKAIAPNIVERAAKFGIGTQN